MSRVSYEGNLIVIIQVGMKRNGLYYYEPNICTLNTYHTISTIIQRDINQSRLYGRKQSELEGRVWRHYRKQQLWQENKFEE